MSAIQARIHYSMKQEFKLLKDIIQSNCPEDYPYKPTEGSRKAKKSDYSMVTIVPVSDPNAATMSQKVVQYQAVLQLSQTAPQLYNLPFLHRQMLAVIGIKNAAKLVPLPEDQKPCDPVTENMNVLKSKPLKAFIHQDHEAHIKIHMAAMNDPKIKQVIGQNPQAPMMMQAMQAHITEHVGMEYMRQMQLQMGIQIPYSEDNDEHMTPEMEMQIARMAVPAAKQLLNQNQTEIAAKNAQQAQNDPIVQMQMQELKLKQQEVQLKQQKLTMDAAAKADQIEIEKARIMAQKEIAGMQVGAKTAKDKADLESKQRLEGMRIGAQVGQAKEQMNNEKTRLAVDLLKHNSSQKKGNK
jgi:cytochrome b